MRSKKFDPSQVDKYTANPLWEGILIGLLMLLSIGASAAYLYTRAVNALQEEIQEGLIRNTASIAAMIDGDQHSKFNSPDQQYDPQYLNFLAKLERARIASGYVPYLYTNIITDNGVYFIANPSPQRDLTEDGFYEFAPQLMDLYEDPSDVLLSVASERVPMAETEPWTDQWGTTLAAYAPIFASNGDFVGTLGMDLSYKRFMERLRPTQAAFRTAAITGIMMAVLVGVVVWYNRRLLRMLDKSRHIALAEFEQANNNIRLNNHHRSVLLQFICRSMSNMDPAYHASIIAGLNTIAELENDDTRFASENFTLQDILIEAQRHPALDESAKVMLDPQIPPQLFGEAHLLQELFNHILAFADPLEIRRIETTLEDETLHNVTIGLHIKGSDEFHKSLPLKAFRQRMLVIDEPDEQPLLSKADDLSPAIAYKMLLHLGARLEMDADYPHILSAYIPFDKHHEVVEGTDQHA